MGGIQLDDTQPSFPTYAELTQTRAWDTGVTRVQPVGEDAATSAAELSHASRYTEGAVLGTGGMGKVVLARDARIGRDVALKVLHEAQDLHPEARARFLREAQVQGQLEHPSIVPVYDLERRADGTTFFTMRRVRGRTLSSIIDDLRKGIEAAKQRYTRRELLTAFATVCLTIDYAHSRGVVHRDLKPANIMLGDFGEVYVLDWGIARLVDENDVTTEQADARLSMPGIVLGTPLYMAPEQIGDPNVGPAADVYALGLILYEVLTYQFARDPNALYAPVDARPSVRAPERDVPPELETICVQATANEEKDRYPSARALHEALTRYLEGDREVAQRRQLASKHVAAARKALAKATGPGHEVQSSIAMSELTRAVALDPRNEENVAMLADILAHPPPVIPDEVQRDHQKETVRIIHIGARQGLLSMLTWLVAAAAILWIGVAHMWQFAFVATPLVVNLFLYMFTLRAPAPRAWAQYASTALLIGGGGMVSCLYGPFVLVPVIITTTAVAVQVHPIRSFQRFATLAAIVTMIATAVLEYAGVLPRSYDFSNGTWTILPQLVELPRGGTYLFITIACVSSIILPCTLIAKLRNDLTDEQLRRATQVWQFKQLGARLTTASDPLQSLARPPSTSGA